MEHQHTSPIEVFVKFFFGYLAINSVNILCKIFLVDDILLLLSENIQFFFGVFKPRMTQNFYGTQSLAGINLQKRVNQVNCMLS
jgi:hypothetical protein